MRKIDIDKVIREIQNLQFIYVNHDCRIAGKALTQAIQIIKDNIKEVEPERMNGFDYDGNPIKYGYK